MSQQATTQSVPTLEGANLWIAALLLALANFIVVLDMTIANVSVPHIAGGLAVSMLEGTYVITSYSVAEAVIVPLTGWLALRFGTLRVFKMAMLIFGLCSTLCGLAESLDFLVVSRIFQGLAGGPMMPLSQTLLMSIFPKEKQATAVGIWGTTTLVAPVLGPIVGGYICDNYSWPFIFFINIPVAIICSIVVGSILKKFETPLEKRKVDFVGLILLILWVGSLQLMLDEGKNHDWFESSFIVTLLILAGIGFLAFLIWELTQKHPIVDLSVFRHKGYTLSVATICLTFGAFFGSVVLTPLWLQSTMGFTASWSGLVAAHIGFLAVLMAPIAAKLSIRHDPRMLVFVGVCWMGLMTYWRAFISTDQTYEYISLPILLQGIGMPFFFLPLTGVALSCVNKSEMASAAGLMNFSRTLAGAFATSIVTTRWESNATIYRSDLVSSLEPRNIDIPLPVLENLVSAQSFTLSSNHIFVISAFLMFAAATFVWLVPKPKKPVDTSAAH